MFLARILLVLAALLFLPDWYIFSLHVVRHTQSLALRLTYWLPSVVLYVVLLGLMLPHGMNGMANHFGLFSRLTACIFLLVFPKLLFVVCSAVGVLTRVVVHSVPHWPFAMAGWALAMACFFAILYGLTLGPRHLQVKRVSYSSSRLPSTFDGFRIVQISDLHAACWHGHELSLQHMVDSVNALRPDLIVFTGDLVNQENTEIDGFEDILSELSAPHGVYSILGNHDYGIYYQWPSKQAERDNLRRLIERQGEMGWRMLLNENELLTCGGDTIALIGVENDGEPPFGQMADLPRAMRGTEGMFRILLSHNPTHWRREVLPTTDIDLTLAGHTHAMQVVVCGLSPAKLKYPEWGGMYYEGERALYVNIGLGCAGFTFRLGAWPEITEITLKSVNSEQ